MYLFLFAYPSVIQSSVSNCGACSAPLSASTRQKSAGQALGPRGAIQSVNVILGTSRWSHQACNSFEYLSVFRLCVGINSVGIYRVSPPDILGTCIASFSTIPFEKSAGQAFGLRGAARSVRFRGQVLRRPRDKPLETAPRTRQSQAREGGDSSEGPLHSVHTSL